MRACVYFLAFVGLVAAGKRDLSGAEGVIYKQFYVDSLIVSRYAVTTITSVVQNAAEEARELSFLVQLPETAFISNFTMSVSGRTYYGVAKEKEAAATEFESRLNAGENVGLVESRGTEVFSVRTNTAANSEATFILQYEDLIIRRRSKYQQVLNLNPGAVVEDLKVEVKVVDQQGVVGEGASEFVTTEKVSDNEVLFSYSPTAEQQLEDSDHGLARDLSVEYDVVHPPTGAGQIVVDENCYFAQFFSPSSVELGAVPVDLVFVIDVSGSMGGRKIEQTREALETIINQLGSSDRFTMVTFSSDVRHWRETLVSVSEYRQQAVQFARGLQADGATDFNNGLLSGASILKTHGSSDHIPLLVILTDGQPTAGVTSEDTIVENAAEALAGTAISLNCLGFGYNLNFQLLERLALGNNGIVRRIYEGEDAADQLKGFFEEISSPILRDIAISFDSGSVDFISSTDFPLLFEGGEIVVVGRLFCDDSDQNFTVQVTGVGVQGSVMFESVIDTGTSSSVSMSQPSTERLAAFLLIKQLLESRIILTDSDEIKSIEERVLQLSLMYNFVTELTSLIVVEEQAYSSGSGDSGGNGTHIGGDGAAGGELEDGIVLYAPPGGPDYDVHGRSVSRKLSADISVLILVFASL